MIDIDLNACVIDKLTGMTLGAKMNELSIQLYDIHVKSDALELNASVSE